MRYFASTVAVVALCLASAAARASTILNENFNALTPGLTVTSVGAFHTVNGTNVDIVGGALFGSLCAGPASGNCVDLDGSNGLSQGQLQSGTLTLMPGTNYYLSFDLIGDQRGSTASATADLGPYTQTFTLASGDDTTGVISNLLITVSSPTTTSLSFLSNTPGNVGLVLDNVSLTTSSSVTPEPSSLLLVATALIGSLAPIRRRFTHH